MRTRSWMIGAAVVALVGAVAGVSLADGGKERDRVAEALKNVKITLDEAIAIARKQVDKGVAIKAELEVEPKEVAYEVTLLVPGSPPQVVEVEIDPATGKVLEIEREGDEKKKGDDDDDKDGDVDD